MENKADCDVISDSKIIANRENSKKSTGPKNTALTRLNALKHGILSKEALLKGEDKKSIEDLGKRLRLELAPKGELECILVDRIISSVWRLRRAIKIESKFVQAEYDECKYDRWSGNANNSEKAWNLVVTRELGGRNCWLNLLRYETSIEKQIYKALHELIRIQGARKGEKPPAPIAIDLDVVKD